ncbi:MAG: HD domain-containing protein [Thermoleophilia bacterium]|nr:HD domain-containing protein [Thermoleophilia bacterium]
MTEEPPIGREATNLVGEDFVEAVSFAINRHGRQPRKGTSVTYVSHLLSVAALVLEMEGSEEEAIAALLHDVVEDAAVDEAEVEERFGSEVAAIVRANSDTDQLPKPPWIERKRSYIGAIARKSPAALRISIADKLHNVRSILDDHHRIGDAIFDRFKNSDGGGEFESRRDGTLWYYEALVDAFELRREDLGPGGAAKLDDLARAVRELRGRDRAG